MMLGFADDDFIPGIQARACIALRHHIDGFGGAARPDDVLTRRSIKQRRHLIAGRLVTRCQFLRFGKLAAVNVTGAQAIKLLRCIDDRLRF